MARKTSSAAARARASLQASRPSATRPAPTRGPNGNAGAHAPSAQQQRRRQQPAGMGGWVLTGTVLLVVAIVIFAIIRGNGGSTTSGVTPGQLNSNNVPLKAGVTAPDFSLPAQQGGTYTLSQYRGKVVLLEFFAPWCPHCRAEAPTLRQLAAASGKDVQLLAVSASPYGFNYESTGDTSPITMQDIKLYVDQFGVNYPALFDVTLNVGNAYGVLGYPQFYVVDRNGVISWSSGLAGEETYGSLQAQIQKAQQVPLATATPQK